MNNKNDSISQTGFSSKSNRHSMLPVVGLLFASTMWGLIWYPLRLLEDGGLHGLWASALMYCGTLIVAVPVLFKGWREWKQHPYLFFFMAIATGWTNIAFILAVLDGNVVRVLLLFYLSPLWATLLGVFFLGEQLSRRALGILGIAMIGAVIMLWHESFGFPAPKDTADWLALSAGVAFAITNVLIHKLNHASIMVKTATGWLGVLFLAFILILVTDQEIAVSTEVIAGAWLLGAIAMTLMNIAVVYGVTNMPVYRSAIILLFEIVVGAVSSILLTNEIIELREWIGGGLVILAAYLTATSQVEDGAIL
ncbi:MAG: DMT family transporter [Gammaproteobacteria bacterium]|nr:DMT family transporter [Gammaproteobacteria bacterium]